MSTGGSFPFLNNPGPQITLLSVWTRMKERQIRNDYSGQIRCDNVALSVSHQSSAYFHSTATLNSVRGLLTSGFASLHHPRDWSLSHVRSPSLRLVPRTV